MCIHDEYCIVYAVVYTVSILIRGVGKRGAGGVAAPPLFWPEMTTSCLQQCLCILMFTGQMEISNCLPPPLF